MLLTYGLRNIFEAKLYSKKDSTTRNVKLLQRFDFRGSYNFAAEEFKWSLINLSANTPLFNGITNVIFTARFDPYRENEDGDRINELVWDERRVPARFTNANIRINSNLTVGRIRQMFNRDNDTNTDDPGTRSSSNGLLSLIEKFLYQS